MNIKKSNIITAVLCTAALSVTSFYSGYAAANTASGIQYNSQGKIVFDNSTEDTTDDVVFDASDFMTIDSMITEGKTNIKNKLNQYGNIEINEDIPAFDTLAASIGAISDGTDAAAGNILSGKKALVGKNIVTGSMANYSGSRIPTNNVTENGTNAEITIPGGYYDGSSKITVPIEVLKKLPTINSDLINNMTVLANGGVNAGSSITLSNGTFRTKAYLIVEIVDDDRRSNASVSVPGGSCTQLLNMEYGSDANDTGYYTNFQVFQLNSLPAGTITVSCGIGYGRCAVLIG